MKKPAQKTLFFDRLLHLPRVVLDHLKALFFLSLWFAVPFFLLMVYFRTPSLQPAVYYTTEASPSSSPGIACISGGGQWQLDLPSGCADNCGTQGAMCTLASSNGCNCGDGKCWNEATQNCIVGTSAMDAPSSIIPSPVCIIEGNSGGLGDSCCPGLISNPGTLSGEDCLPGMGTFSCTKCGNGVCAAGENWCNCPVDCSLPTTSPSPPVCVNEGDTVGYAISPEGFEYWNTKGKYLTCCQGLRFTDNTTKPASDGLCQQTDGIYNAICTNCGNGECGLGENKCNCPSDCPTPTITSMNINFSIRMKGINKTGISNQPLYFRLLNSNGKTKTYNPVVISQDSSDTTLFRGKLDLDTSYIGTGWTVIIKGPVHLQRRFDNMTIVKNTELNLTGKILLPGDLQLPQSGQNDIVDYDDRDYLWSLVSLTGRSANSAEIRAADLDLNNRVDNRDYSLLIDTGIGTGGEH